MTNNVFPKPNKNYQQWAPLLLRLIIGFGFMAHGWAKLSTGSPAGFEKLLTLLGVPFPHFTAWATSIIELVGGFIILIGFAVRRTAIPLICIMLVAMFGIQIHYGFSSVKTIGLTAQGPQFGPPGYEINLLYIAGLISLMFTGAGIGSVDALVVNKKRSSSLT
jgi:putative oxidoreductase